MVVSDYLILQVPGCDLRFDWRSDLRFDLIFDLRFDLSFDQQDYGSQLQLTRLFIDRQTAYCTQANWVLLRFCMQTDPRGHIVSCTQAGWVLHTGRLYFANRQVWYSYIVS